MVCKITFCSEFTDISGKAGRVTKQRRRTQAIAERFAFYANAKMDSIIKLFKKKKKTNANHKYISQIWLHSLNNNKKIFGQFLNLRALPSNKRVVAKISSCHIFCYKSRLKIPVAYPNNPKTHFPKRQTKKLSKIILGDVSANFHTSQV